VRIKTGNNMVEGNTLTERISFDVTAPYSAAKLKGITEATARLERMQVVWNRLQGSMTAMSAPVVIQKSMQDVLSSMEKAGGRAYGLKGISLKPEALAKQLVLPVQQFQNYLQQALLGGSSRELKAIQTKARRAFDAGKGEFRSARSAAEWVSYYTKQYPKAANPYEVMQKIFGTGAGSPVAGVPTIVAQNFGQRMAAARKAKAESGKQKAEAEPAEKEPASKAKAFSQKLAQIKRDLAEDLLKSQGLATGDNASLGRSAEAEIRARQRAAKQVRGLVGGDTESKQANDALAYAAKQEQQGITLAQQQSLRQGENLAATRTALNRAKEAGDKAEQKRLQREVVAYERQRANFQRMEAASRGAPGIEQQAALAAEDVRTNERLEKERQVKESHANARKYAEELKAKGAMQVGGRLPGGRKPEQQIFEWDEGGLRRQATINYGGEGADVSHRNLRPEKAAQTRWQSAVAGMSLPNMAANVLKVTEWAAAVAVLYKSVELLRYSLKRMEDTGMEMAHLSIVFRGVGGSVAELTSDMIKLASAQGRSTSETMESAIAWSRLGGDRKAINEEVRLSALAANIAQISMVESTKQLQSLSHIYGLDVAGLSTALGGLVNTSLKYNVTLDEMFVGLDRSAAAAKVAGISLSELQAMIGVVVGATGQTGSMTGNSLKYIFQEINKPEVQRQLRGYGVEARGNNLEMKPGGQILSELSGQWGTLGSHAQQSLSGLLGGRFNAARVPIVLQDYPRILQLAIDAQLNLNKAQETNVKILDTLHAQLEGIHAEWDRLVMSSQVMGPLSMAARTGKNLLGATADAVTSGKPAQTMEQWRDTVEGYLSQKKNAAGLWLRAGWSTLSNIGNLGGLMGSTSGTPGLFDIFNYSRLTSDEKSAGRGGGIDALITNFTSKSEVASQRQTALALAMTTLRNGTMTNESAGSFAGIIQKMQGGEAGAKKFMAAYQSHDFEGASTVLNQFQHQATQDELEAKGRAAAAAQKQQMDWQTAKDELVAERNGLGPGAKHDDLNKQIDDLNSQMSLGKERADALSAAYQNLAGDTDDVSRAMSVFGGQMKGQEAVASQIEQWFNMVAAVNPLQALSRELAVASTQLDYWQQRKKENDNNTPFGPLSQEQQGLRTFYNDQVLKAEQAVQAANDPVRNQMAQKLMEQQSGGRGAQNFATANDYGIDAAAKALSQLHALQADRDQTLKQLQQQPGNAELNGRLQQEDADIWQRKLDLARRFAEVNRDIKQLAIDQNKEFMRSFYGDGPAQMLQKLAAFRMAFNGDGSPRSPLSQGAFFGLSPGMRQDYGQLNPQYNPQMIELQNERNRIIRAQNEWKNPTSPGSSPGPGTGLYSAKPIDDATVAAAASIHASGTSLGRALEWVGQHIKDVVQDALGSRGQSAKGVVTGGQLPKNPQSGGVGGANGFAAPNYSTFDYHTGTLVPH